MLHQITFRAMGCDMLAILEYESMNTPSVLWDVPKWFEEWEQSLSRFRLNSELSLLNRTFDQPVQVSKTLWDVFQTAAWAEAQSAGLVTPTVLDAMLTAGYDQPFEFLDRENVHSGMQPAPQNIPLLSQVIADEETQTLNLPKGTHLDFGGVAKGWAAHQAMQRLQEYGPCLVNAGGDIAVSGPQLDGSPWPVGVSSPFEKGNDLEVLFLRRAGVATSGKDRRNWKRSGRSFHHIIDPLTGVPAETNILRATVIAPTVVEAEMAAKTVFILGHEEGVKWIESHETYACLIIMENREIHLSTKAVKYLEGTKSYEQ